MKIRLFIIFQLLKLFNIKLKDLQDYPYNVYSEKEIKDWWNKRLENEINSRINS